MFELGIVLGVLALLVGGGAILSVFAWDAVFIGGWVAIVIGFAFGVPTGAVYHVLLYRALKARGPVPARWWLHPTSLHDLFDKRESFFTWMVLGALGFAVIVIGCIMVLVGALRSS